MTAATLQANGLHNAGLIVTAAADAGLELAVFAALIEGESHGRNVWGSDRTKTADSALPYVKGGQVTREHYLAYLARRDVDGAQGCGPGQLTLPRYQDMADQRGGCWNPAVNLATSADIFADLVRVSGGDVHTAFRRYRGYGLPASVPYADRAMARLEKWRTLLMPPAPVSQNGYPANNRALVARQLVPGTGVAVTVRKDEAGWLLLYVLGRFDAEVEDLDLDSTRGEDDDWGYAERLIRDGDDLSNHASGTAVDANATRHVLGRRGTFTRQQVAAIRRILADCRGVVRWGGDYATRADEMHFELVRPLAEVVAVARRLQTQPTTPMPGQQYDDQEDTVYLSDHTNGRSALAAGPVLVELTDPAERKEAQRVIDLNRAAGREIERKLASATFATAVGERDA